MREKKVMFDLYIPENNSGKRKALSQMGSMGAKSQNGRGPNKRK